MGLLQSNLRLLLLRHVERGTVKEPRAAIFGANQFHLAMEPNYVPVACNHPVYRPQRLTGENELGCFHAPTASIVRVDLVIPPNRIVKPFLLSETQKSFNVGTDISLAQALIEKGHEDHGGNLLHQGPISRGCIRWRGGLSSRRLFFG